MGKVQYFLNRKADFEIIFFAKLTAGEINTIWAQYSVISRVFAIMALAKEFWTMFSKILLFDAKITGSGRSYSVKWRFLNVRLHL